MNLIPFGEVDKERVDLSKRYNLIEVCNGIWRLTKKCKDNYDSESYVHYLKGDIEKPRRITKTDPVKETMEKQVEKQVVKLTPQQEMRTKEYQEAVDELFKL